MPAPPQGTFYDKANTLRASMAGGALVQRAEFIVDKATFKTWGSKALVMLALVSWRAGGRRWWRELGASGTDRGLRGRLCSGVGLTACRGWLMPRGQTWQWDWLQFSNVHLPVASVA